MSRYHTIVGNFHTAAKELDTDVLVEEVVNELSLREGYDDHIRKLRLKIELAHLEYCQRTEIDSKIDEATDKIIERARQDFGLRYTDS